MQDGDFVEHADYAGARYGTLRSELETRTAGGAPVLLTGIGLPDDGLHSPNEKVNLQQIWDGIEVFGDFFKMFAEHGAESTK